MRASFAIAMIVSVVAAPGCLGAARHGEMTVHYGAVAERSPTPVASHSSSDSNSSSDSISPSDSSSSSDSHSSSTPDPWLAAPTLETLEGRVSYYHDSLAGNHTANGELYDPTAFTCASRDLPFGTLIRIVRPDTGASVIVRVNDRGPWGRRRPRILDLSRAAAEAIDMVRAGVIEVRAEIVRRGE